MDEQMKKLRDIPAMEYYSTLRMNKVVMHATTRMNLETHAEWKKSGTKGHVWCDSTYRNIQNRQIFGDRK